MIRSRLSPIGGMLLLLGTAGPAAAQADPGARAFAMVTRPMAPARRAQFCAYVADQIDGMAGAPADPAVRTRLAVEARQLRARLAPLLAPSGTTGNERENGQAMGLLSYAPSSRVRQQLERGDADDDDVLWLFASDVGARCQAMFDQMKLPPAPPGGPVAVPPFQWDQRTGAQIFAGTPLAPVAARLCNGAPVAAADLKGLPLTVRGADGISLLDWTMQCRDRAGFAALLEAAHDVDAPGADKNPPLVNAAGKRDLWYLKALLARGARPDAMGERRSALVAAFARDRPNGGEAFALLRAAGASLDFPDAERSIWDEWARFGNWELVLANWTAFKSDPVALGRWVTMDLANKGRRQTPALDAVKGRLESEHGVCFPVGATAGWATDARGFLVQPDCPRRP